MDITLGLSLAGKMLANGRLSHSMHGLKRTLHDKLPKPEIQSLFVRIHADRPRMIRVDIDEFTNFRRARLLL